MGKLSKVEDKPLTTMPLPDVSSVPASRPWRGDLALWCCTVALAGLWADLIYQLGYTWSSSDQYGYGWFVPPIAVGLLLRNWGSRPASDPGVAKGWMLAALAVTAIAFLPIRVLHETNPDWPLVSWPLTLAVVGVTCFAMYTAGGWPWVKHFSFTIAFILVAVKWPYRVERGLIQGLMRTVAAMGVEVLGWIDIPALQRGNLIEIDSGVLGVDEACSGIRSFQTTLMGALFLGELYRLTWGRRTILVVGGLSVAFALNVVRAVFLSWKAAHDGMAAVDKWHDPAGLAITVVSSLGLWGGSLLLMRVVSNPCGSTPFGSSGVERVTEGLSGLDAPAGANPPLPNHTPETAASHTEPKSYRALPKAQDQVEGGLAFDQSVRMPRWLGMGLLGWVGLSLLLNQAWYAAHAANRPLALRWWVGFPIQAFRFQEVAIAESARKLLRYDRDASASWIDDQSIEWSAFCFRWNGGDPGARMSAQAHRPEFCLTGSGHELKADLGSTTFAAHGLELAFRTYVFESRGSTMHVFHCLWEDGAEKQRGFGQTKSGDRLRSTLEGRRDSGQQTLEIILRGCGSVRQAEAALREALPRLITLESATHGSPSEAGQ